MAKKIELEMSDAVLGLIFTVLLLSPYGLLLSHDSLGKEIGEIRTKCNEAIMLPPKVVEAHLASVRATIESERQAYGAAVQKRCIRESRKMEKTTGRLSSGYDEHAGIFRDRTVYISKCIKLLQ